MSTDQQNNPRLPETALDDRAPEQASAAQPLVTVFSIPKPFFGHTGIIQRNAIESWKRLAPEVDVILFGDEEGVAETAMELEVRHFPDMESNEHGTPLVSSAFSQAIQKSDSPVLCYCNCDVMLFNDFVQAISEIDNCDSVSSFVAIGRRTEIDIESEIDFEHDAVEETIRNLVRKSGSKAAIVCKEFFAYSRDQYRSIPPFAVGRGNWDNWMVASAKRAGTPVIDVSQKVTVIHQNHDYGHISGNRMECYVTGAEAKRNQELAGGRHIVSGATATWKLTPNGVSPKTFGWANLDFWLDLPRFSGLLLDLARSKRK
ncbi:MAG: hypothetical protein AAF456_08725 [Planctomycetota bacterium]